MKSLARPIRMILGLFALAFLMGGSSILVAGTAGAVSYTPPAIDTKPVTPPSGEMTLNGTGFIPNSTVTITIDGVPLGTTTVSPSGTFSFNFQAPSNLGTYQLSATDGTNDLTTSFRVTTGGGGGGELPFTGSSSSSWLTQFGVGLLALGAIIVAIVRSKSRTSPAKRVDINA